MLREKAPIAPVKSPISSTPCAPPLKISTDVSAYADLSQKVIFRSSTKTKLTRPVVVTQNGGKVFAAFPNTAVHIYDYDLGPQPRLTKLTQMKHSAEVLLFSGEGVLYAGGGDMIYAWRIGATGCARSRQPELIWTASLKPAEESPNVKVQNLNLSHHDSILCVGLSTGEVVALFAATSLVVGRFQAHSGEGGVRAFTSLPTSAQRMLSRTMCLSAGGCDGDIVVWNTQCPVDCVDKKRLALSGPVFTFRQAEKSTFALFHCRLMPTTDG
ncbi:hypothetical protein CYMTET_34004 [Cymbomonas tetramitiformis]|uniref:Uncharacterized protein n=1 Tax=Cymbomonas tetramitiformis TaxID=36881 RepID=A0AAE0FC41_9CHLO|nr:hypothetical protein CYMTET_34004 [Cymbomonas tetramitiformis]